MSDKISNIAKGLAATCVFNKLPPRVRKEAAVKTAVSTLFKRAAFNLQDVGGYGLGGAAIGGLGSYLVSKLLGSEDAGRNAVMGALAGGLGGAGYGAYKEDIGNAVNRQAPA